MTRIITIANHKGGSGKTTTTLALAQLATIKGKRVLCIDSDCQANLTIALCGNPMQNTAYDAITKLEPIHEVQKTKQNIDLITGSRELFGLSTYEGSGTRLKCVIKDIVGNYDLVFIDTPPTLLECQLNAMQASTDVIYAIGPSLFDIQGFISLWHIADYVKVNGNPTLNMTGYILTNFNGRSKIAKHLQASIQAQTGKVDLPCLGIVRQAVAVREAQTLGQSLYEYAPNCTVAKDYQAIYEKLGL